MLVREKTRPAAQQSESELLRQREKIARGLDALEGYANDGTLRPEEVNLATISTACAIAYLNFRRVAPGWCATRPKAGSAGGFPLSARQLCAHRTAGELTQTGNSFCAEVLQLPLIC
ncbi:glutathione S-transferase [Klebsiella grimontii]|nr:glutathione S-transferase [Klebsiella grimontii]